MTSSPTCMHCSPHVHTIYMHSAVRREAVKMFRRAWRVLHQPRVWLTVEPVLFLYMFATFLSYNTLQVYLKHSICSSTPNCSGAALQDNTSSSSLGVSSCGEELHQIEQEVQTKASHWLLYLNIASGVPSVLVSLFYGGLSDQLGRKLFIVLPVLGTTFNAVTILLVIYFSHILPLAFLLLGSLVSGIVGNFSVVNFAVYSYASDVSAETGRTRHIGVLEAMTYLGGTLSLVLGGLWITKSHSFASPIWCVIACELVILVYVFVALPESWKQRRVSSAGHSRLQSLFKSILRNLVGYFTLLLTNWRLAVLMITYFVVEINFLGISDVVIFYSLGEPLCWGPTFVGFFLALKVFLNGIASLLLLPLLSTIGVPDTIIVLVGLVSGAAALVIMGLSTHTWMMFIVPVIGSVRGCVEPCVRSMLSKTVDEDKKGILFSGVGVLQAVCTLVASVIYNSLYPATREVNPGLCFFVMAGALILPFMLTVGLHIGRKHSGMCCHGNGSVTQESENDSEALLEN